LHFNLRVGRTATIGPWALGDFCSGQWPAGKRISEPAANEVLGLPVSQFEAPTTVSRTADRHTVQPEATQASRIVSSH